MSTSLPTPSIPHDPHQNAPNSSRISIALVAAALFTFALFVFFSIHRRPSRDPSTTSPPSLMNKPSSMCKPKLWEVCLDEDHDAAVRDWQVSHAPCVYANMSRDIFSTLCSLSTHGRTMAWGRRRAADTLLMLHHARSLNRRWTTISQWLKCGSTPDAQLTCPLHVLQHLPL